MAIVKYALVVDGDVFMTLSANDGHPRIEALQAGMESSPIFVDATDNPEVSRGWTWDGVSFTAPKE